MLAAHIGAVLAVTGIITALPVVLFAAPAQRVRQLLKLELADRGALFIARHWGLLAFAMGALLAYAAGRPELRAPGRRVGRKAGLRLPGRDAME